MPGVVVLTDLAVGADVISGIVLQPVQDMLLNNALQMAHDDYIDRRVRERKVSALANAQGRSGGRKIDRSKHARIVALRTAGRSIADTAELVECDRSTVKRVWASHRGMNGEPPPFDLALAVVFISPKVIVAGHSEAHSLHIAK